MIYIYGGIVLNYEEGDQSIDRKTHINTAKKWYIARRAVLLINDGESLIFDAGSTVLQMSPWPAPFNKITVMTNSLIIINKLVRLDNDQVILIRRRLSEKFRLFPWHAVTEAAFSHFNFDKLVIGANSVDLTVGVTTFNELHAVSQEMRRAAQQLIRRYSAVKIPISSLITDSNILC